MMQQAQKRGSINHSGMRGLVIASLLLIILHSALRDSLQEFRNPTLTLVLQAGVGIAKVNGKERLRFQMPSRQKNYQPGLYLFNTHGPKQVFRSARFRNIRSPGPMQTVFSSEAPWHKRPPTNGWHFRHGSGVMHAGQPGSRGTLMLDVLPSSDFELEVAFENLMDAGILICTDGPENAVAVVLRPQENDLLVFPMEAGRPGALLGIAPIETLQLTPEFRRAAHLLAGWLGTACFLAWVLCVFARHQERADSPELLPDMQEITHRRDEAAAQSASPATSFCLAVVVVLALTVISRVALNGVPHITDETSYLFQAKILAKGHLRAPLPLYPEFFTYEHVVCKDGYWFSKYPPFFPLLLAMGTRVGLPWLINPLLGGLLTLVMLQLARELFPPRTAWFAWVLTITSPFFMFMSASLMAHTAAALLLSLTWLHGIRLARHGQYRNAIAGGLALAAAMLTRPFSAFCTALPLVSLLLWTLLYRDRTMRFLVRLIVLGLLALVGVMLLIGWNRAVASLDGLPTDLYTIYDPSDSPGFGFDKGAGQRMTWGSWGHTPAKAMRSATQYAMNLSHFLFGWPINLSLVLLPVFLVLADRRARRLGLMLLLPWATLLCGHVFYWATEHTEYGPRYWFEGLPGIILVSAAGMNLLFPGKGTAENHKQWPAKVLPAILITGMIGWSLAVYFPRRIQAIKHRHSFGNALIRQAVRPLNGHPALVFVQSDAEFHFDGQYLNDPFMEQDLIVARDLGEQNQRLIEQYPNAAVYKWDGNRLMERRSPKRCGYPPQSH